MKSSGKTRESICREAGLSRSYLSLLERGDRQIGIGKVSALASALGVEPSVLRPELAALAPSTKTEAAE